MATIKTVRNDGDVGAFLASVADETRRNDAIAICKMMRGVTRKKPEMWGDAIVGFGTHSYRNARGDENDWFVVGFSPRKQNLTVYIVNGFDDYTDLLADLGPHSTSKSCLYIKRLADVDQKVLRELVTASVAHARKTTMRH
ncbi:MAG: DUF1801 domain-containing protein [Acidimicrobiia bacterium]